MKIELLPKSFNLLFKATSLYNIESYSDMSISEIDEVKEQLMTMRIYLAEGIDKLERNKDLDEEAFEKNLSIISEFIDELSEKNPPKEEEEDHVSLYDSYTTHS